MPKALLPCLFCCFFSSFLCAQEIRELATDRPGLGSDAPITVPRGYLQVEAGFQMDRDRFRQGGEEVQLTAWSYPTTLFRYGILDRWEFRMAFDALTVNRRLTDRGVSRSTDGLSALSLGSKVMLTEESGWLPYMSLQFGLSLAGTGSNAFETRYTQPTITWLMTKSVTDDLSVTVNLGTAWEDDSPAAIYSYALSMDMALAGNLGAFLEFYGDLPELGRNAHAVNYGLTYLLQENLQFDISSGVGLVDEATDYFIGLGISGRIGL